MPEQNIAILINNSSFLFVNFSNVFIIAGIQNFDYMIPFNFDLFVFPAFKPNLNS